MNSFTYSVVYTKYLIYIPSSSSPASPVSALELADPENSPIPFRYQLFCFVLFFVHFLQKNFKTNEIMTCVDTYETHWGILARFLTTLAKITEQLLCHSSSYVGSISECIYKSMLRAKRNIRTKFAYICSVWIYRYEVC